MAGRVDPMIAGFQQRLTQAQNPEEISHLKQMLAQARIGSGAMQANSPLTGAAATIGSLVNPALGAVLGGAQAVSNPSLANTAMAMMPMMRTGKAMKSVFDTGKANFGLKQASDLIEQVMQSAKTQAPSTAARWTNSLKEGAKKVYGTFIENPEAKLSFTELISKLGVADNQLKGQFKRAMEKYLTRLNPNTVVRHGGREYPLRGGEGGLRGWIE